MTGPEHSLSGAKVMTIEEKILSLFPAEDSVPEEFRLRSPLIQREYLTDGELRFWDGPVQEVRSPVWLDGRPGLSRKVIGAYPLLTQKEGIEALEAAVCAYHSGKGAWPAMPLGDRVGRVEEFLHVMRSKKKEITRLLMWEIGKSYRDAEKEFDRTADYLGDTIEAAKNLDLTSSKLVCEKGIIGQIRRSPLGIVFCTGPFNFPLYETLTTLFPALIMGNTAIFKPPKLGVLLHQPLLRAFRDIFPPGVVNIVCGDGSQVVTPLLASGKVDVLAFIGSSRVADLLRSLHPRPHRLRSVLGLEAKNPALVLPDADLSLAVGECVRGSLAFNGQRCTALKILFVHSSVVDQFVERFAGMMEKVKFGMPWEKDVVITPLAEPEKTVYLKELVDDAVRLGANIVNTHGGMINRTFFYPALLYPVNSAMRIYREEQFGPLAPVVAFDDIEEPVQYIVESSYGQQMSIFGRDTNAIAEIVDVLVNQVCRVNINSLCQRGPDTFPFAGRKDSGEGTLSVIDALRAFSIRTIIATRDTETNKRLIKKIVSDRKPGFLLSDLIEKT